MEEKSFFFNILETAEFNHLSKSGNSGAARGVKKI
jgi:hypothetical protein